MAVGRRGFTTSGTSGHPVTWWRSEAQLDAEARWIAAMLPRPDLVVISAPGSTLYGHLCRRIPALTGARAVPEKRDALLPRGLAGRCLLVACVSSTWSWLLRQLPPLNKFDQLALLHSGSRLPAVANKVMDRLAVDVVAVELLGATETGAIARRPIVGSLEPEPVWTLCPDVTLLTPVECGATGMATIAGPRLGAATPAGRAPSRITLRDLVERVDDRHLRLLGREGRLVKINGAGYHLDHLEAVLDTVTGRWPLACLPVADNLCGEHYEIVAESREGMTADHLRRLVRDAGDAVPAPRAVHLVPHLPRSPLGKIRYGDLLPVLAQGAVR
jgi:acyl-coenzyme A synthetase/AMP-(fatty) acid ligase